MPQRRLPLPKGLEALLLTVTALLALLASSGSVANPSRPDQVTPLAQAHAHNDYEHARPLTDALDHGFTSVEVDVWLIGGELFVAHDYGHVTPGWTLETLYLEPLAERVRANGGSVYPGNPGAFHLLIDVKSEAGPTYLAIHRELRRYRAIMTRFSPGDVHPGAVTATISGNRDLGRMADQQVRYAASDGRLSDLDSGAPADLVPLVSADWTRTFTWRGVGPMPEAERAKLHEIVAEAHANGREVRFWDTPDAPAQASRNVWRAELAAGVDFVSTDHLATARRFILTRTAGQSM